MKEFAQNLREELNNLIFSEKNRLIKQVQSPSTLPMQELETAEDKPEVLENAASIPPTTVTIPSTSDSNSNSNSNSNWNPVPSSDEIEDEEIGEEEREQIRRAKLESLKTYILG